MTITGQPLTTGSALDPVSQARAEALERARYILVPLHEAKLEFPYEAVGLARWIYSGEDIFNETAAVAE